MKAQKAKEVLCMLKQLINVQKILAEIDKAYNR